MKRAIKPPTKAQAEYQEAMRAQGCAVCHFRIVNGLQVPKWGQGGSTHLHHRNLEDKHGQPQLGQHAVVAMCAWHHEGVIEIEWPPLNADDMREIYGPSFKLHAKDFRVWTEDVLPGMGRGTEAWQAYQEGLIDPHLPRYAENKPESSINSMEPGA